MIDEQTPDALRPESLVGPWRVEGYAGRGTHGAVYHGYGSIEYARQVAHGLTGAALHESSLVLSELPDSPDKEFLAALPTWVLERA